MDRNEGGAATSTVAGGMRPQPLNGEASTSYTCNTAYVHTAGGEVGVNAKGGHRDPPAARGISFAAPRRHAEKHGKPNSAHKPPLTLKLQILVKPTNQPQHASNRLADIQTY